MMKEILLLALTGFCLIQASSNHQGFFNTYTADMEFLHKQKKIYELLFYVKQGALTDMEFYDIGRNYDIESNIDMYTDKTIVQYFLKWYHSNSMLSRDAIYSHYYEDHREEMLSLFKLFYYAKDFQTFYKTACWARCYLNDGVFVNAFTIAVLYRPDCKYIRLPAIYEIYPNQFFDSNVIQEAHRIQMTRGLATTGIDNTDSYMIYANYTGHYVQPYYDEEYKLDYYMEDVSLNAYYYYFRTVFPFYLNSKEYNIPKEFRGDFYYYFHQQLMARYYLERFSNDLGEIEYLDWYKPLYPGYYSTLMYGNGIVMPQRERYSNIPYYKYKYLKDIESYEFRIYNAIDSGFVYDYSGKQYNIYTPEGLNILANLIEGNADSCNARYYGMYDALARDILGFNYDYSQKDKVIPSALQYYSTSMRDPAFYRLYNKILGYFYRYKYYMPSYTHDELAFPGVKFESVNVDKLQTYFDYCDTFINNGVYVENFKEGSSLRIKARRYCLNYKPFTYRFNINSEKETKAVVRIFLGPAFDKYNDYSYLRKYYKYFVQLDQFIVPLKTGLNNFERRSTDSIYTMPDMLSSDLYYKKLIKAVSGSEPFTYYDKMYGFPQRLYLPKGKPEGMRFKLFFYVTPLDESKLVTYELPIFGKYFYDGKPFGYPFDRPIYPWKFFVPNMFFKDVYIYHNKEGVYYQNDKFYPGEKYYDDKYYGGKTYENKYYSDKFYDKSYYNYEKQGNF
ncbi:arylphorin subunit alpha-like [Prorops nasuta]